MDDVLILGGGVIGLSLAYELSQLGLQVRVLDRAAPGQEASWAGAGILPAPARATSDVYAQLGALSYDRHLEWAGRLREETGIDNGLRVCGGLYVQRTAGDALASLTQEWQAEGIRCELIPPGAIPDRAPVLCTPTGETAARSVMSSPEEAQIRNPRHLKALLAACRRQGVVVESGMAAENLRCAGGQISGVDTPGGIRTAGQYVIASGAWSRGLLQQVAVEIPIRPVRGQIVLLQAEHVGLQQIVNEGARYIVPRADGRVLIGSTEEMVGFDKRTTAAAMQSLLSFALDLVPALEGAIFERCWAGLRPGTPDRLPYLGRVADLENLFLAAGHFRAGLQLSTGTALLLGELLRGEATSISLDAFALDRDQVAQ